MFFSWLPITKLKIFSARILYFFTTLFVGREKRIIDRKGIKFEVDLSEGIELSLYLFGNFQDHVINNSFYAIKQNDIILDIGTNVGLMTLQFAQLVPQGKVYSFEPTHYALERLKRNISLNPGLAGRIEVINSFVSERSDQNPEIVAFSSWKVDGQKHSENHPVHLGTPKPAEGVPSITLDDFVKERNITRLDFIKIDTDGHEYEVFKGAKQTIKNLRPYIVFEIGLYVLEEKGIDYNFYNSYFSDLNYTLYDTKTKKQVTPENHKRFIPNKGSTDLIAVPN
jgi:FkbM family methyltransferase